MLKHRTPIELLLDRIAAEESAIDRATLLQAFAAAITNKEKD